MKALLTLTILLSLSLSALAGIDGKDVIYGEDNRHEVFESRNSAVVEASKSTAAMVSKFSLKALPGNEMEVSGSVLTELGICEKERFSHQTAAANCSGFLVAPNILVTAGHCIKSMYECAAYRWVFDYKVEDDSQKVVNVPSSSVYGCTKIIARSFDPTTKDDYAVIQLDRKVQDRRPLRFRRQGKVAPRTPLVVIGHPTGLPTKIADNATVRSFEYKYFVANLDTYGGNSGSAVFNANTLEVEGILVRGENDFVSDPELGCQVSNRCPDQGCRGEDVVYITNIPEIKDIR